MTAGRITLHADPSNPLHADAVVSVVVGVVLFLAVFLVIRWGARAGAT
ncbi:hypothetical protein GJ629_02440 [Halapricum sp. CBA1109]|nr:hypothetical protein [Halapricum sp. CBA1109]MUV88893.1 hypothetical protein [Halapricum sp. CBA1109]